jgi:hypothetical protein
MTDKNGPCSKYVCKYCGKRIDSGDYLVEHIYHEHGYSSIRMTDHLRHKKDDDD